jgi:hypothetical protein
MLDRLDGKSTYTEEDDFLTAHFDAVASKSRSYGNARIGKSFIRKYRNLLPEAGPREVGQQQPHLTAGNAQIPCR